jgi:hypothetical protein
MLVTQISLEPIEATEWPAAGTLLMDQVCLIHQAGMCGKQARAPLGAASEKSLLIAGQLRRG